MDTRTDLPFGPFEKVHRHSNDPECVALASKWLRSCLEDHNCSAPSSELSPLLTRFLNVGSSSRNPHLVDFAPGESPNGWAALSYCWGQGASLTLTRKTEDLLRRGIKISTLDATLRDAIEISRKLQIQHLWIDALCIFQENVSDWLKQSSQMSHIYGNATVTIVSVDTDSVSQSFSRPRDIQYVELPWNACVNQDEAAKCRNSQQVFVSHTWPARDDQLIGPWSKRGWTLQEGLIPNRLLFYSSQQIAWKCRGVVRYERGLQYNPANYIEIGVSRALFLIGDTCVPSFCSKPAA